jgi:hypothetical protein
MRIIGQAVPTIGVYRKRDFALDAARRRANQADRKIAAHGVSITTGAVNIVEVAASAVQRAFASVPGANVTLGKPSANEYANSVKA